MRYVARYSDADKIEFGLNEMEAWPVRFWDVDAGMAAMQLQLAMSIVHRYYYHRTRASSLLRDYCLNRQASRMRQRMQPKGHRFELAVHGVWTE